MRTLSEKYKELASRAGRYPKLRMELYAGTRGAWTDTVEAEYNGENAIVSATYTNGITTKPSRFETGLAFCGSLEIELHGVPTTPFANGKRFKLFAGFYDPDEDDTVEASVGEFFIESVSADNGKMTVKARDKMMYGEQKFNAELLTYPCSLLDCVREIFRQMGFTMPEDYTLDINPTVRAPAWQKPNMTEGVYSNGTYYVEDPQGYGIMMPGAEKPTKGHAYNASTFALTCREALESVAKMQLGNCFIDGDGIPRFSSYKSASPLGDDRVTGLSVGEDSFTINSFLQNYMGYDVESVTLFKRRATERKGEIMYYTNFPSDLPESYDPIKTRVIGKTFYEGTVERKGLGETEIGDFIDYSGKLGKRRFFVSGLQYEWSGGSFDETLYSFAPDYKGVDYEWLNDRDLVADEDKEEKPKEEEKTEIPEVSTGGVTIDKAVLITEADAKYLLHSFTEIEYNEGNRIVYAGPGNQIVTQGFLAFKNSVIMQDATSSGYILSYPKTWTKPYSTYMELSGDFYNLNSGNTLGTRFKKFYLELKNTYNDRIVYNFKQITESYSVGNRFNNDIVNYDSWGGVGLFIEWFAIFPPNSKISNTTFEFGYAQAYIWALSKGSGAASTSPFNANRGYNVPYVIIPFSSLAEYEAAVGLTYETITLTRVEDSPTVVSSKDIGGEVT